VAAGADVTLFAALNSVTTARLDGVSPHGYADDPATDGRAAEAMHVSRALARSGDFDLVHNHLDWLPLAFAEHCRVPLVTTVHGISDPKSCPHTGEQHRPRTQADLCRDGPPRSGRSRPLRCG
jgi:hypothetical protein